MLSPFQFGCLFFLFRIWSLWLGILLLCWIEVVKADTLVLFLILVGNLLSFPVHFDVGCRFLVYSPYYVEIYSLYSHFAECFIINGCCTLSNVFFWIYWYDHVIFLFLFFMWCIIFIDLWILYHPCIPGMNPTWSWCLIFSMYCCMWFSNIFFEDFSIYVHQWYWPVVFFLCCVMIWFWDFGELASEKEFGSLPSSWIFWNSLWRIWANCSLNVL